MFLNKLSLRRKKKLAIQLYRLRACVSSSGRKSPTIIEVEAREKADVRFISVKTKKKKIKKDMSRLPRLLRWLLLSLGIIGAWY